MNPLVTSTLEQVVPNHPTQPTPAAMYNSILPIMQCVHCGLQLNNQKIWDYFNKDDWVGPRPPMWVYDGLLSYPEKGLVELFETRFRTLRYCCKMSVLDTYLHVKRRLADQIFLLEKEAKEKKIQQAMDPVSVERKPAARSLPKKALKKESVAEVEEDATLQQDFET